MNTFYDILGVAPTASADDIKAAYRRMAMQFHPDKTPGANKAVQRLIEDKFKEIQEAYDTLKDETKRAEYDAALAMLHSEEYYQPPPPPPPPPKRQQQQRPQPPPPPPPPKQQQQQQPQPLPPLPIGSRVGIAVSVFFGWVFVIALLRGLFEQAHGVIGDIPTLDWCLATIYSTAFFFIIMCRSTHSGLRVWVRKKRAVLIGYLLLAIGLTWITMAAIRQKSVPIVSQQQTSQVAASQPPTAASQQPPKPASQPQTNVPLASPTASQGVTHTPMAKTPHRFDSRHPSVGEPQGRDRSELRPTTPSTVTANETSTDSRPSTAPRRPDLSGLSRPELESIEAACVSAKYNEGPAAYNRCLVQQLDLIGNHRR